MRETLALIAFGWGIFAAVLTAHGSPEAVAGNTVWLANAPGQLAVFDVSNSTNAVRISTRLGSNSVSGVAVFGHYIAVAALNQGLVLYDVSAPPDPQYVGIWGTQGNALDVAVTNGTAFIAEGSAGIEIIDVHEPANLLRLATLGTTGTVTSVQVSGNLLYAACGGAGLRIYNVSDPSNPVLLGQFATTSAALRLSVSGSLAYVACAADLEIINVQTASLPFLSAAWATTNQLTDLDVAGSLVLLADTNGFLTTLSISNLAAPLAIFTSTVAAPAVAVRVVGNQALVGDGSGGLQIVALSGLAPAPPVVVDPVAALKQAAGQPAMLSVVAVGTPPLTYRWYVGGNAVTNSVRISGSGTPYLSWTSLVPSDSGLYTVAISNAAGWALSSNILTVLTPGTPVAEGSLSVTGMVMGVDSVNDIVYAAAGSAGLASYDATDARFPNFLGSANVAGTAMAVSVAGDEAFVAAGSAGLQIYSVVNTVQPEFLGGFQTNGTAYGLEVNEGIVYLADGAGGLQIIDATVPANPVFLGGYATGGTAYAVDVSGGKAYVAAGSAGVKILSVSNRASVTALGAYPSAGIVRDIKVVGNLAYVAADTAGLLILNVSNPANPVLAGSYVAGGPVLALAVADGLAVLAEGSNGLETISVATPTNLFSLGADPTVTNAVGLKLVGATVYVAVAGNGIRILNLSGITAPAPLILAPPADTASLPQQTVVLHVVASGAAPLTYQWYKAGQILFETANTQGAATDTLTLYNVQYADSGTYSVVVKNAWNLTASSAASVSVVPLGTPIYTSAYFDANDVLGVQLVGQLAYLANRLSGLQVVDCHDPLNPVLLGSSATTGLAQSVKVSGSLAYVAAWNGGLDIFDVFNPTNIVLLGQCAIPGFARGIEVTNSLAYVAAYQAGLQIVDVHDPTHPFLVGQAATDGFATDVRVAGTNAYVACSQAGLEVFGVSDPLAIRRLGSVAVSGNAEGVELGNNRAYVAGYNSGLAVIDISNPALPQSISTQSIGGDAFQVQMVGNLAYVAGGLAKVKVIDLGNPAQPALVLSGIAGSSVHGVQMSGNYAFMADRQTGLVVSQLIGLPALPPRLLSIPAVVTAVTGQDLTISARTDGTPPLSFQWYWNGLPLVSTGQVSGATGPNLRLQGLSLINAGTYQLSVSSPYGSVSSNLTLIVTSTIPSISPSFVTTPTNEVVSAGGMAEFKATLLGTAPLDCRWYHNGLPMSDGGRVSGAATADLQITGVQFQDGGSYQLKVWNGAGLAATTPVTLTFVGALQSQINAASVGQVLTLPAGTNNETLVITKDVTLTGSASYGTILDALGLGTVVHVLPGVNVTLTGLSLRNGNGTNDQGGAVKNEGHLILDHCLLANSSAGAGGGLANLQYTRITYSTLSNNASATTGGGIFNGPGAMLDMDNSTVTANIGSDGGGLYAAGNFFLTNCLVSGNTALGAFGTGGGDGGGIRSSNGSSRLVNSTLSGNQAQNPSTGGGRGGGLRVDSGTVAVLESTIAFNTAAHQGGGIYIGSSGVASVHSSIVANNQAAGFASDFKGVLVSAGYNLVQTSSGGVIVGNTTGNLLGVDPLLGPLQDNGGPTWTRAISFGSPAIDAGNCDGPAFDQRGMLRPFDVPGVANPAGGCDIGAFEFSTPLPMVVILTPNQSRLYGTTNPVLTASYFGLLNGDTSNSLAGTLLVTTTADTNSPVGVYPIVASGKTSTNYTVAYLNGTLTVAPVPLTVAAVPQTKVYGSSDPPLLYQIASGTLVGTDSLSGNLSRTAGENVGVYSITQGTLSAGVNYAINYVGANLSITQPQLMIAGSTPSSINFSWTGSAILQSSTGPAGPWQDVSTNSPFSQSAGNPAAQFYRLKAVSP